MLGSTVKVIGSYCMYVQPFKHLLLDQVVCVFIRAYIRTCRYTPNTLLSIRAYSNVCGVSACVLKIFVFNVEVCCSTRKLMLAFSYD